MITEQQTKLASDWLRKGMEQDHGVPFKELPQETKDVFYRDFGLILHFMLDTGATIPNAEAGKATS